MEILNFQSAVWGLLRSVTENMDAAFRPVCEKYGLTLTQFHILAVLAERGPLNVGELGRMVGMTAGNMSALCKKLEKIGFFERVRDTRDERVVKIRLTEKAEGLLNSVRGYLTEKYAGCFEKTEPEELIAGLQKLNLLTEQLNNRLEQV